MESTFNLLLEIEKLWDRFKKAENKGQFKGLSFAEHVADAHQQGFINDQEAEKLVHYNARRYDSMLTDVFDLHLNEVLELENPYLIKEDAKGTDTSVQTDPSHSVSP